MITKEIEQEIMALIMPEDNINTRIDVIKMVLRKHLSVITGEEIMHFFEKFLTGDWKI
jgi:hypothetical protein